MANVTRVLDVETDVPAAEHLIAADHLHDDKRHLLLCASGSVATIKLPQILRSLSHHPALSIRLVLTASATNFLAGQAAEQPVLGSLIDIPNVDAIYSDADEWLMPWTRGAPILHIELRRWADIMVIAPLSANSLAKMVAGMSDNLLLSVVRAWDTTGLIDERNPVLAMEKGTTGTRKRIVVAPAMNTAMWRHPITNRHIGVLEEEWGVHCKGGWVEVLRPQEKELACGDVGDGAMKEWTEIVKVIEDRLHLED